MASRLAMLKNAASSTGWTLEFRRLAHVAALSPPLDAPITSPISSPPLAIPEFEQERDRTYENNNIGFAFPPISIGGSMELMAVPKKKVSRHKRGIRNGPKALKPVPVIIRCKSCGRVKLPHFFCCSGERNTEQ